MDAAYIKYLQYSSIGHAVQSWKKCQKFKKRHNSVITDWIVSISSSYIGVGKGGAVCVFVCVRGGGGGGGHPPPII